jgi:hypothetical protein
MATKTVELLDFTETTGLFPIYSGLDDGIVGHTGYRQLSEQLETGTDPFTKLRLIGEKLVVLSKDEELDALVTQASERLDEKDSERVVILNRYFADDYRAVAKDFIDHPYGVEAFIRFARTLLTHENVEFTKRQKRLVVGRAATMLSGFLEIDDNFNTQAPSHVMVAPEAERQKQLIDIFGLNDRGEIAYDRRFSWLSVPMIASQFGISGDRFLEIANMYREPGKGAHAYAEIDNLVFPFEVGLSTNGARPILLNDAGRRIYDAFLDSVPLADK